MIAQVLARVILSVSGNAVQKRLVLNGAPVSLTWIGTYALMLLPSLALALARPAITDSSYWSNILLGGFLDAFGNLAMVAALRATDLSVFGPLNAFRPVLALLFGWFFLGELPTVPGALGVGITVSGAMLLLGSTTPGQIAAQAPQIRHIVSLRLMGLSLSTIGAVFLKRAANVASAELTLCGWIVCGLVCLVLTALLRKGPRLPDLLRGFNRHRNWLMFHAALFFLMQLLTIRIFQQTLLAYSFVFFQLGMVLQVLVGRLFFSEPAFKRRLAACLVMAAGSALIFWKG